MTRRKPTPGCRPSSATGGGPQPLAPAENMPLRSGRKLSAVGGASRAAKTLAHAVLIVVPKSQVAYPTVWKGDENWPCAVEADGFICQLETPEAAERKA